VVISSSSPTVLQDGERWYTMFSELIKSVASVVVGYATVRGLMVAEKAISGRLAARAAAKEEEEEEEEEAPPPPKKKTARKR